jgi:soluble lytic murein transglycosylase-like protein
MPRASCRRRNIKVANPTVAALFLLAFTGVVHAQQGETDRPAELGSPPAAAPSSAGEQGSQAQSSAPAGEPVSICQLVAAAAAAHGLPFEFFARVIWQESRFRSDAVGPVTRSGRQAQGIAQFMPTTAAERLLRNPFDPIEALPKSAEFLRELQAQFGNLGLAAAAYNAGPARVRDWLAGRRTLPSETQAYVRIVTGRRAEEWRPQAALATLNVTVPADMPCGKLVAAKPAAPPAKTVPDKPAPLPWTVQLIGDRSEAKALAAYQLLQKKHEAILANYQPTILRTAFTMSAAPTWTRIRIDADSRQAADTLCSRLRAVGETCLVQRN